MTFVTVQQGHTRSAKGYHPPYLRTGEESVIANRNTSTFAQKAKEDGKVISVTEKGIIVEYKSGKQVGLPLGRVFGRSEGSIYPHDIVTKLKQGQTVKAGTPLSYNSAFFEEDDMNPGDIVYKGSLSARVALWETKQTHEDASAISKELAQRLGAITTYEKSVVVSFGQNVHNVVPIGKKVTPTDELMIVEDEITSSLGAFDQGAASTLSNLAKQGVKANYLGIVDHIEVLYNGDKDDMTPSLRKLTDQSDRLIKAKAIETAKQVVTGVVPDGDYRVKGNALALNKAEIKFLITVDTAMGVADKLVFANQMKSIVAEVMDYEVFTEDGKRIDAFFGTRSIANRNVTSPYIIGTTSTLCILHQDLAISTYRGTK